MTQHTLSARLWARTKALHVQAERSGYLARLLRGEGNRLGYAMLLHNLLPVYQALEKGLARHAGEPGVGRLALPQVWRVAALRADLATLGVPELPALPAATSYAAGVAATAEGDGAGLIGHAYTRTMGDLSGGQILRRLLGESLQLGPDALSFYHFPAIADVVAFKSFYRDEIDAAEGEIGDPEVVLMGAEAAFRHNIALSEAIEAAVSALAEG